MMAIIAKDSMPCRRATMHIDECRFYFIEAQHCISKNLDDAAFGIDRFVAELNGLFDQIPMLC